MYLFSGAKVHLKINGEKLYECDGVRYFDRTPSIKKVFKINTACFSGAAKLARKQRGEKKIRSARPKRGDCFCSLFSPFAIQY